MQAITLSRKNFREYDQVISVYTKEKGRLDLIARGVKKTTSRNSAHLEPFSFVDIETANGKEFNILTKVRSVYYFPKIRSDLEKSLSAQFAVLFLTKLVQVEYSDKRVFEYLKDFLKFLELTPSPKSILLDAYILGILRIFGLSPMLDSCVLCSKTFREIVKKQLNTDKEKRKPAGFYFAGGGIVCPDCRVEKIQVGEQVSICGLKEISNMIFLLKANLKAVSTLEISRAEQKRLHGLIYQYTLYHSEKKIVDWGRLIVSS